MSVDAPEVRLNGFFQSEVDKMSQAAKEAKMDGKSECLKEPSLLGTPETLTVTATQSPPDESWEEQCELNSDQMEMLLLKTSLLNGYNIDEDVKGAVESGNIKEYCRDLVPKLTEYAQNRGAKVIKVVVRLKDQAFALVREERQRKRHGKSTHGDTEQENFKTKLDSLPKSSRRLVVEALTNPDPEHFCNRMGSEIQKTVVAMHAQAKIDAQRVAAEVSKVAREKMKERKVENKCSKVDGGEKKLERRSEEENLANSDSNTSSLMADEEETFMEAKDLESVESESNTTNSQASEGETTAANLEEVEKHVPNCESDEDSEKPAIGTDDEHVIPTPPPPPPLPVHSDKGDEIQETTMEFKKYQVNQLRKELSFAIARLTSEVVKSYEQACILQKHGTWLEKSALDFIEKQETKKTFYIKEISTRVDKVLKMLSPQPEMNMELQDLDETVKLLHFLQTTRNYHVDKIAVTTATNSFIFNFLPPLAFFVIILTLSLNGEWLCLIVFLAVILICAIKSCQGMNSAMRKRVEVFARKKKAEKID